MWLVDFMGDPTLQKRAQAALESVGSEAARDPGGDPIPFVVSAGDAVEALLADYLLKMHGDDGSRESILYLRLEMLIEEAYQTGGISDATKNLCHGVRLMRNLSHSTKEARTGDFVTIDHVKVAAAVAGLVRLETYNNSPKPDVTEAEGLWVDIEFNPNLWGTIDALVAELSRPERVEFLEVVRREVSAAAAETDKDYRGAIAGLGRDCAKAALSLVPKRVRSDHVEALSATLRGVGTPRDAIHILEGMLFAELLDDIPAVKRRFLLDYIIGVLESEKAVDWPEWLRGIGPRLRIDQVDIFVTVLARSACASTNERLQAKSSDVLVSEVQTMESPERKQALETLYAIIREYEQKGKAQLASEVAHLRYSIEPIDDAAIPR